MQTGKDLQKGFTYLFVLMLIALTGLGLAAAGTLWSIESRREREAELLFIGAQYRQAIESYYTLDPAQPMLPQSLDDLIEDRRSPQIVRHLRKLWHDPITGEEFSPVLANDRTGIIGVASQSTKSPLKKSGFNQAESAFTHASTYADWLFVASISDPAISSPQDNGKQAQNAHLYGN